MQNIKDPSANVEAASSISYPLEEDFSKRANLIIMGLAKENLDQWRKGYFSSNDPGKYLPLHAMAKLILNPGDQEVSLYMNDDRSYKEHYHFAAVNWARFIPIFGSVLSEDTLAKFANECAKYSAYIKPSGTENHKIMSWTSANVLPYYIKGETFAGLKKNEALASAKKILKNYVKSLYVAGQGEWDSPTYLAFDLNGMMNIYDFSKDEECRLLAKAALDWYVASYALKYRDGIFCAPNQRGFSDIPYTSPTDQTGYLWWGGNPEINEDQTRKMRYSVHAILSAYRPNRIITNIAIKNLPNLPIEQHNCKPNYWHGLSIEPEPCTYRETIYIAENYSIGSLNNGHGGQITRFQIVVSSKDETIIFTGGSPRKSDHTLKKTDFGYSDGTGRYDQSVQTGPVYICVSMIPEYDDKAYSFFSIPDKISPSQDGEWFIFEIDKTFIAVRGVGSVPKISETELSEKEIKENEKEKSKGKNPKFKTKPIIKFEGRKVGFIVQTAEKPQFNNLDEFKNALRKTSLNLANFANNHLIYADIHGRKIEMILTPSEDEIHSQKQAECMVNGKEIFQKKCSKIYDGPLIQQEAGILQVSDGVDSFVIDFSGDMPVYKKN